MTHYRFTRKELKEKSIYNFQENDVIRCGKYRIEVHFADGENIPRALTGEIMDFQKMRSLSYSVAPHYIQDFFHHCDPLEEWREEDMSAAELLFSVQNAIGDEKILIGRTIMTLQIGEWPGGAAKITELHPDPVAPEIVFMVKNEHGEIGVFAEEYVELLF